MSMRPISPSGSPARSCTSSRDASTRGWVRYFVILWMYVSYASRDDRYKPSDPPTPPPPTKTNTETSTDLFKWASKLGPYAPSSLVEEALRLAIQCRVLDMRASPYDLRALDPSVGFGALCVGAWGCVFSVCA